MVADRPYVLLSAAMSADGYLDDATGARLVLSDETDLDRVDGLRAACDAILVGAQTVRADNPRLLVRSAARRQQRTQAGRAASPLRVTISRDGRLDPAARLFTGGGDRPLVYVPAAAATTAAAGLGPVATVVGSGPDRSAADGRVGLRWLLADLARRGVRRLLVEGGASILAQFLTAGLADEFQLAVAPLFVADPAAPRLLRGPAPPGRMTLASVLQAGDMAVLRYLPSPAKSGLPGEGGLADGAGWGDE